MRSIVYNGIDLSEWCSAEVIEKVALPVVPETMVVPGRAGALLVSGRIPPRLVFDEFLHVLDHLCGSFPNSDFPDTMAYPEGHHAEHQAQRGHQSSGFRVYDSTYRLFGQVTSRKRKTPDF